MDLLNIQIYTRTISKSFEVNRFQYKTWPWKWSIPLLQCRDLRHINKTSSLLKFWKILIHQVEEKISKTATAICNMTWLHAIVYCHRVFCYDSQNTKWLKSFLSCILHAFGFTRFLITTLNSWAYKN